MKMFKKLVSTVLALMMLFLMIIPANADGITFVDVPFGSPWAEGIQYVAEKGISLGTGNNHFSANDAITTRQWAVMISRAMGNQPADQPGDDFGDACIELGYKEGWIDLYGMLEPDLNVSRGSLYESAFAVFDIPTYNYELYSGGRPLSPGENYVRIAKELGICSATCSTSDIMTRGETAQLIYLLSTQKYQVAEPPILSELHIVNTHNLSLNKFLLEIEKVPQPILDHYHELGWRFVIDCNTVSRFGAGCVGVCSYQEKAIYVSERGAIAHEFGHFLHYSLGFPVEFDVIYREEVQSEILFGREYAFTNSKEYFADCFAYWVQNEGRPEKMNMMRDLAPDTYAYFSKLASNGWIPAS